VNVGAGSDELSYEGAGLTDPGSEAWSIPQGFRHFESTVGIGRGDHTWGFASGEVLTWGVKRRSGFRVSPAGVVAQGTDYLITAGLGPLTVREPVRVVAVVDTIDRCGFAYGTLHGHPVSGEEAFIVHRDSAGAVSLTIRSLTRPAPDGVWRLTFPVLLLAQRLFRRRYLRALAPPRG
jgi:uncharacterized protein (UPF0548 family)